MREKGGHQAMWLPPFNWLRLHKHIQICRKRDLPVQYLNHFNDDARDKHHTRKPQADINKVSSSHRLCGQFPLKAKARPPSSCSTYMDPSSLVIANRDRGDLVVFNSFQHGKVQLAIAAFQSSYCLQFTQFNNSLIGK